MSSTGRVSNEAVILDESTKCRSIAWHHSALSSGCVPYPYKTPMTMLTFRQALLMHLPIPASRLLLGINNTSNPHHKQDLARKLNHLWGMFEPDLKLRGEIIWRVRRYLPDSTLNLLNALGKGDDTLHQGTRLRGPTAAKGKVVNICDLS